MKKENLADPLGHAMRDAKVGLHSLKDMAFDCLENIVNDGTVNHNNYIELDMAVHRAMTAVNHLRELRGHLLESRNEKRTCQG